MLKELRAKYIYDPATGRFDWRDEAGFVAGNGYRYLKVGAKKKLAHRMAWLYHFGAEPDGLVDHINGNRLDNRIENLRIATFSQNAANAKLHVHNTSGLKGASWMPKRGKWQATITVQNKQLNLGYYKTKEEAHDAYMRAAEKHQGEFAHSGADRPVLPPAHILPSAPALGALGFGA